MAVLLMTSSAFTMKGVQPFIIGLLVGFMAEQNFRRALMFSDGSFGPFFTHPISLLFLIVAFVMIAFTIYSAIRKKSVVVED